MKCFICHNIRHTRKHTEYVDETLKLIPSRLKWTMFDGSKHDVGIVKCQECTEMEKDLMKEQKGEWVEEVTRKLEESKILSKGGV